MRMLLPRMLAILIAILAAIDPAITSERAVRPEISVIAADSTDLALADRLARQLSRNFTILDHAWPGAAATVIAGDHVSRDVESTTVPVFAVIPELPSVAIEDVRAPASSPLDARVPILARLRTHEVTGRTVEAALTSGGLTLDRASATIGADGHADIPLTFIPSTTGPQPLTLNAIVAGDTVTRADIVIDVEEPRWSVLFFDRRASWMSTFVRRAVETDARFVVTSRTITSRNVSIDANRPPASLADLAALELYDVIVVGAPDALTDADVAGLNAFLRERGGAVVLLMDHGATGPYERLAGVTRWSSVEQTESMAIGLEEGDTALRATGVLWPSSMPAGSRAVATLVSKEAERAVVWRAPVGAGRLVVSGALDAWRFRDPSRSMFNDTWRRILSESAESAAPALDVSLASSLLEPDAWTDVIVTVREASLSVSGDARASVSAALETNGGETTLHLWPDGEPGRFRGRLRAPSSAGTYRLVVSAGNAREMRPIVVASAVTPVHPDERAALAVWAVSRGGRAVEASQASNLAAELANTLVIEHRRVTWHPMRSAWWIVPFVLLLGIEWWLRRRQGLA
jgi:hypothetical protein